MKVLIVAPQKNPYEKDVANELHTLQKIVGGHIEAVYTFEEPIALVCFDEAKLTEDTEWNRILPEINDVIKGTFFLCGLGAEDFDDLPQGLIEKYKERFWNPEYFIRTPHGLMPIKSKE